MSSSIHEQTTFNNGKSGKESELYVKVNPRLHAPAKFMVNPRGSLSIHQQRTAICSTKHSTSINLTNNTPMVTSRQGNSTTCVPSIKPRGTKEQAMTGQTAFAKQYKLYRETVIRTKPASLFRANLDYQDDSDDKFS